MFNMVSADDTISQVTESLPQDGGALDADKNEDVPWKGMLYQLYGNEAELFLNSDMHFKKKLNPRLLKLGGGAGSGPLFKILRNESIKKLLNQDSNLPDDLKDTYEAYVHQCVSQNQKPVPRVFCAEGNRLEKKYSFYQRKPLYEMKRRQANLMYRLCQRNQDRTQICIYNNPLPNFSNSQGMSDSAVARYIPHYYLSTCSQASAKSMKDKSEELEVVPTEEDPSSGVGATFLTESQLPEEEKSETDNKAESDCLGQQNSVYRSLETLYDLDDPSQYGYKLLYLSHLMDYEGAFSAHFQKDPEAPRFLQPLKDIDLKFSTEALEAVRMPHKKLPRLVKDANAGKSAQQCSSDSRLTAATLLEYLPYPTPKVSLLPPIYASRTVKQLHKKGPDYNKPRTSLFA